MSSSPALLTPACPRCPDAAPAPYVYSAPIQLAATRCRPSAGQATARRPRDRRAPPAVPPGAFPHTLLGTRCPRPRPRRPLYDAGTRKTQGARSRGPFSRASTPEWHPARVAVAANARARPRSCTHAQTSMRPRWPRPRPCPTRARAQAVTWSSPATQASSPATLADGVHAPSSPSGVGFCQLYRTPCARTSRHPGASYTVPRGRRAPAAPSLAIQCPIRKHRRALLRRAGVVV